MRNYLVPALLFVLFTAGCGDELPPWLTDNGNTTDSGRDVAGDVIRHDTVVDTHTDAGRDVVDVRQDVAADTGIDTFIQDIPPDQAAGDAIDALADSHSDADAFAGDVPGDAADDADAADARDTQAPDINLDFGWECVIDDDCTPPVGLGQCEAVRCMNHACLRGTANDLVPCNDGSVCTTDDRCNGGVCAGTSITCDDGNICTNDYCNPSTGCATSAKNNIPCDDKDPCTVSDRCTSKVCRGTDMLCATPPAPACSPGLDAVVTWTSPGTCVGGTCEYDSTSEPCRDGCANAECLYDPCYGITCTTPPGQCRESVGDCVGGDCVYDQDNTKACTDGNPCTTDTCVNGTCSSTAITCTTPPVKKCSDDGMSLRTWAKNGTCVNGTCQYVETVLPCSGGCVNAVCSADPCAGVDCSTAPNSCMKSPGVCVGGDCVWENDDGATCSDNNECTSGDYCQGGQCRAGTGVDCDDSDLCTADSCDPSSGCDNRYIGNECDDNNPCTNNECSPLFGCDYPWNNASCTDDNACTVGDFCDSGKCVPGIVKDCDDGNVCTSDSCNIGTGCVNEANAIQCRPAECVGLVLKPAAFCANKSCQIPADLDCDDGQFCTIDSCSEATGCGRTFATFACDDGNPCTGADKCQGGACSGTPVHCNTPPADYCLDSDTVVRYGSAGNCSGGNCQYPSTRHDCTFGCTDGACNGDPCEGVTCRNLTNPCKAIDGTCSGGLCSYADIDGIDCDTDASVCTTEECQGGACTFKGNLSCDDGKVCTDDDCNPATGCVWTDNSAPCDDGNACTTPDVCSGGTCGGTPVDCSTPPDDVCDGATAVHYGIGPCINGTCDWTTTRETCMWGCAAGVCAPDPCAGVVCDHGPGQCREEVGECVNGDCVYDPLTGTDCDLDGSVCTPDKCDDGICIAEMPLNCDEGNLCEDYWCDPVEGCRRAYNTASCDDNDKCTENDSCLLGACRPGTDKYCGDTNICTDNGCDPLTGCTITNNSDQCDDSNPCTSGDTCAGGSCGGTPYSCEDLPCADRTCDGLGGCEITVADGWCAIDLTCYLSGAENPENQCETCIPATSATDWTPRVGACDDADPCTPTDECILGACAGSGTPDCDDGEYCTDDTCLTGIGCDHRNRTDACDDGEVCTENDTCGDGECTGTPRDCGETTACVRHWCENGVGCREEYFDVGCDDGDPCTVGDWCLFGSCATAGQKNCNDYQSCTTDSCSDGNCVHTKLPNLTPCNDGNPCTSDDKCINGYCGGTGLNCFDENVCTDDTCNVETMTCEYPNNTHPCDDGNACTQNDRCGGGACSGAALDCNDNKVCTDDSCNTATGCVHQPNTQACDDGNKCTENDVCGGGECTAGTTVDCDDHNECTQDLCYPTVGCVHNALSRTCDDGDPCTYNDYCFNKVCSGVTITCSPTLPCTTAACNGTDRCEEGVQEGWCVILGACVADDARPADNPCVYCNAGGNQTGWTFDDGIACDDDDACTAADTCLNGECGGAAYSCDDGLDCTADACRGDLTCDNIPAPGWCAIDDACWRDGQNPGADPCRVCDADLDDSGWTFTVVDCDDGSECTVDDYCGGGTCHSGVARNCNDGNVCTTDTCDPLFAGGCRHSAVTAICATAFCDGLMYHAAAMCSGTTCPAQTTTNCDDGNQCTNDQCTASGCLNTARTGSCNDGNPCTSGDTCTNATCTGTPYTCIPSGECVLSSSCKGDGTCTETPKDHSVDCSTDGNPCTADKCDGAGKCGHDAVADGQPCNDNNLCTAGDTCLDGMCSDGTGVICTALDDCHVAGECNPATGLCSNPVALDGTDCNDGNPCTFNDVCTDGKCAGPDLNSCNPLDDCHGTGSCNPTTGLCSYPSLPDGTGCNDGNPCTTRDVCSKGTCRGLNPISCAPVDPCHYAGTCNTETGLCEWPERPDGTSCDDSNACTTGTTCSDGACGGGTTKTCPPINNCHFEGVCNTATGLCSQPMKDNGTSCTDGNACSHSDQCVNGTCTGTGYICSDGRACTTDTCLGNGTCSFVVNPGSCLIDSYCRTDGQTNSTNGCQVCDYETAPDSWTSNAGASCNDFRQDTMNDLCVGAVCQGTPYDCSDGRECTDDVCDGLGGAVHFLVTGFCLIDGTCFANGAVNPANPCQRCLTSAGTDTWSAVDNGLACDDGQDCSFHDKCQSGTCQGTAYSCDDGLDCTLNFCRGDGSCGGSLQDGWCLIWGSCVPDGSVNPVNICQQCSTASALTAWSATNEGGACDDSNPDTANDHCIGGDCIGTGPSCVDGLDCTADLRSGGTCDNPVLDGWCLVDGICRLDGEINTENSCQVCNPGASQAAWSARQGNPCSDNDPCTLDDICVNQVCTGTVIVCNDGLDCTSDACSDGLCASTVNTGWCLIGGDCIADGTVNPSNPCDICDTDRLQVNWTSNDGAVCDDGNQCSSDDACVSRICRGTDYGCEDAIACTVDACDGTGGCTHDVASGWCMIDGNCVQEGETNTWNSCLVCDGTADPLAWSDNVDAPCDDGDLCTWPDDCDGSVCTGVAAPCDDGLECTSQACDGTGGCGLPVLAGGWCLIDGACFTNRAINPANPCLICKPELATASWSFRDGVACDDDDACTVFDTCGSGVCGGTAYTCQGQEWCFDEACDGLGSCLTVGIMADACFIEGTCRNDGERKSSADCGVCDAGLDQTAWSPLTGQSCDDAEACTYNDYCNVGACQGTPHPCDDGLACTDDVCDGSGGCAFPVSSDWCLIDGSCLPGGSTHPTLDCTVCAPTVNPTGWTHQDSSADEICNGADDNCDGITDPENAPGCVQYYVDADHDGAGTGSAHRCLCAPDGIWASTSWGDCDDTEPAARPGALERCDAIDNDCDSETDEAGADGCTYYFYDVDGDGYGQPGTQLCLCEPNGFRDTPLGGDCNDASTSINPGKTEVCNGVDDNCDGMTDPDGITGCVNRYRDEDVDGYGAEPPVCMCSPRGVYTVTVGGDCGDLNSSINPGRPELCNKIDDDCDGGTDTGDMESACPLPEGVEPHGTKYCDAGECALNCQAGQESPPTRAWHDADDSFMTGCECEADQYESLGGGDCDSALYMGSLSDTGSMVVITGNLPAVGAVDWYSVDMADSTWNAEPGNADRFHVKVMLDSASQSEFEVAVTEGKCSNNVACGSASLYEWAVDFRTATLGENPCTVVGNYCPDGNPADYDECLLMTGDAERCHSCPAVASPDTHACTNNSRKLLIKVSRHPGIGASCNDYNLTISNGIGN